MPASLVVRLSLFFIRCDGNYLEDSFRMYVCQPGAVPPFSPSILCVLSFSMRLLETRKTATQREIYYTYVKHFANQVTHMSRLNTAPGWPFGT